MASFLFQHWSVTAPIQLLAGAGVGILLGLVHFMTLKWNTKAYLDGDHGLAFAMQVMRFALLIAALTLLAKMGAISLLSGMAFILLARAFILRRERRAQ
jgi:F1F0 ATPase subunit 2